MDHLVLIAPPRSGARLLQSTLTSDPTWTATALSNAGLVDAHAHTAARDRDFSSNRLTAADVTPKLRRAVLDAAKNTRHSRGPGMVTVDWDPLWSLRVGALANILPSARFVLVTRRPEAVIASLVEAWRSGRFVTEPDLPGWWGERWSFPLTPDWQELTGAPLPAVCAGQWSAITAALLDDLALLPRERWCTANYEALIANPRQEIRDLADELGLSWAGEPTLPLPLTSTSVSAPSATKWHVQRSEITAALPPIESVIGRLATAVPAGPRKAMWTDTDIDTARPMPRTVDSVGTPFASSFTDTMASLLAQSGTSLVISTYKSGHVILARNDEGRVNLEFTPMSRPMGIAVDGGRMSIGTTESITTYSSNRGVAPMIASARAVDVGYAPRSTIYTGDVAIHDMSFDADGGLHFVNTRFSCLCRPDLDYSFVPTWRPQWISGLAAEDRCHLNGLAMVDGAPRYVTALAVTDEPQGWRALKGTSGVIVDVTDDRIVAQNLSMPHSPRWHQDRLWVLESGKGTLAVVDVNTGEVTTVATLPGFTRGLAFIGKYAIVGLSQVRESVFSSLPVTEQKAERNCGVWVVDTESGVIVGYLRFEGVVQEIFEVQVLPATWPVILAPGDLTKSAFVLSSDVLSQVAHGAR